MDAVDPHRLQILRTPIQPEI